MVHWKRDLDLYTIGRPLERNAGFWLNYMKGLKGDHDSRPVPGVTPAGSGAHPHWAQPATGRDLLDPRFPLAADGTGVGHSAELDDIRDIIARANRRRRQQDIDEQRRRLGLY
ncbi:uncharacterized protein LOC122370508 isoform X3 [Amphibalanus amphitrite]|uniref:uncharacterized protein LOC122370508 isoform X2 n=1 Tax=Amphibalanus amphitrite TaxID=1232801 RepID=UPI001C905107|nr:uncharacterized protein LOC122370508 isoform X2 [Amphibalanus amphitrite]XP_043202097.1 uncharacterized protein LOC122370508 isoform X3 [Amphibalanus amphitrite]